MSLPKLLVFASGSKEGGGSGFRNLVHACMWGELQAEITGVVSNHPEGGVRSSANVLGVPFTHFPGPFTPQEYQRIARESGADFFALSGWLKLVKGLDLKTSFNPRTVFNIHPGPLPGYGGRGLYGHHVHEAVMRAYRHGLVKNTAVTMHFVSAEYDRGPIFFALSVKILPNDNAETLATRVNAREHKWQPTITNLVVSGQISWDGVNPDSLKTPAGYNIRQIDQTPFRPIE